ncbi:MAG: dTDP-4-dehydrorhamnose reductase family protein [Gammaproteobacteria bacterium]
MREKKKVLVLGATGMLGHKLVQKLSDRFDVCGTVRGDATEYRKYPALADAVLVPGVVAEDVDSLARALDTVRPDVAINCIGIVKQLKEAQDPVAAISINALLPHQLAQLCGERGVRLIHFSTDCVFSGREGNYREEDFADANDLYGRTKLLGEVTASGCLTLRTSILGRELDWGLSLIEWFLSQRGGHVKGFARALYSGMTTNAMADLVGNLISNFPDLSGLWHVSSDPISKYDLLKTINHSYDLGVTVERDEEFFCDRRLDSSRFRARIGFCPKSWDHMITDLHDDPTPYYSATSPPEV